MEAFPGPVDWQRSSEGAPRTRSSQEAVAAKAVQLPRSRVAVGPRLPAPARADAVPGQSAVSAALRPPPVCGCFGLEGSRLRRLVTRGLGRGFGDGAGAACGVSVFCVFGKCSPGPLLWHFRHQSGERMGEAGRAVLQSQGVLQLIAFMRVFLKS